MGPDQLPPKPPGAPADHSRFVQRVRRRYSAELALLPAGLPDAATITALTQTLMAGGRPLASALRVARQLVLERLAVLDVEQAAPLADITETMTQLAEATLEIALAAARSDEDSRSGAPLDAHGQVIDFWIIGMGKLGARELNVSSDIDLIYVYEEDGQTPGLAPATALDSAVPARPGNGRSVSAHEYFSAVAKRLYALIGETTDDGFVFRSTWRCGPTATPARRWSAWRCWKSISWCKAASGSASPGSRAGGGAAPGGELGPGAAAALAGERVCLPPLPGLRHL